MQKSSFRAVPILLLLAVTGAVLLFGPPVSEHHLLAALKESQASFDRFQDAHPLRAALLYFGTYVLVAALSLPGAAVMTLAGGALFGLTLGTVLASFASAIGATFAFLLARHFLRDWVLRHFGPTFAAINRGFEQGGAFYLVSLRLVPALPYFVTNVGMSLTGMRVPTYFWASQLGMLAGTIVYVNAGTQLARIERLGDIMSPGMVLSFVLLALLPLAGRLSARWLERRRGVQTAASA